MVGTTQHASVRRERTLCTVSQVTNGVAVVPDPPSTSTFDTPALVGPILSPASAKPTPSPAPAGPIRSPASAGPIPSPASAGPILSPTSARPNPSPSPAGLSTSTTPSRRPRNDPKGASASGLPPPSRRLRRGSSSSTGPPPEVHEDDPVRGPEPVWYPGRPVDASLLIGYANHAARRIWDGTISFI
ncbi:lysine-rich arabinogalactan protein 19-like [Vicia villosa]|uniref:lysine-rich arabinogalactan protein 19-like n=1 Tax=Vicia villosa TaxID=3911 RepID=UPI00273C17DF|nr:lysine-rich arabinogalactan protein 19-like [Vicia villosa]